MWWTLRRTGNETLEEWLVRKVLVVLLEMLLGGLHHLDGNELVARARASSVEKSGWWVEG